MNDFIEIKQAEDKDIPLLEEIYFDVVEWLDSVNKPLWPKERVSWEGLSKEFSIDEFYIAYINDEPAACVALNDRAPFFWADPIKTGESLFLRRLAVKRFASGKNFSKYLLEYAVEKCREKNIKTLRLDCDTNIEKLNKIYQSFGFICDKREIKIIGGKEYSISYYVYYIDEIKAKTVNHYECLIDERNDPYNDPPIIQEYMDKWDGQKFIDELKLDENKTVLEIGVGTGRIAAKICDNCINFTGIDFSPKTIEHAKENLKDFNNINLICADFSEYNFDCKFDVIYSSLTFMHIQDQDKPKAIQKIADLLNKNGRFVLSINKNRQNEIDMGNRKIPVFPDNPEKTKEFILNARLFIENKFETEFAVIFTAVKK